jgi:hypothetical protein
MDQFRQRRGLLELAAKRVCHQLRQMFGGQGRKHDLCNDGSALSNRLELAG